MPRDPLRRAAIGHPGRAVAITSKVQAWGVGYAGRQCHSGCVADAAVTARPAAACRPSEIAGGFKRAPASESESESDRLGRDGGRACALAARALTESSVTG